MIGKSFKVRMVESFPETDPLRRLVLQHPTDQIEQLLRLRIRRLHVTLQKLRNSHNFHTSMGRS